MQHVPGEMTELAEGARLEIVCAPKAYLGFESLSLRQTYPLRCFLNGATVYTPMRRGGRVVECGGLENRFTGIPGDEGSNPSSSARFYPDKNEKTCSKCFSFLFTGMKHVFFMFG